MLAAAMGEDPYQTASDQTGNIEGTYVVNNSWWGVSGLASANLSEAVHAEAGAGYQHREGDGYKIDDYKYAGFDHRLTIGHEGQWFT